MLKGGAFDGSRSRIYREAKLKLNLQSQEMTVEKGKRDPQMEKLHSQT